VERFGRRGGRVMGTNFFHRKDPMHMHSFCKTGLKALVLTAAVLALTVPLRAAEPDKLAPADTEAVMVLNLRQMLDSPLVKKEDLDKAKEAMKQNPQVQQILTATGFDPLKDLNRVTLTAAFDTKEPRVLVIARGRFDVDKIGALAADHAKKEPDKLTITKEGGVTVYEMKGQGQGQPAFAAFPSKDVFLLALSKDYLLQAVKNVGKEPAKLGKDMTTALGKVGGKESLWFAAVIPEEAKKAIKKNPPTAEIADKLQYLTGSLNFSNDFQLAVQVHTTDAEAAEKLGAFVDSFKPLLSLMTANDKENGPKVAELVKQLKIVPEKSTLTISLKLTEDQIKKLEPKK
jgi:hypothetical protein